MPCCNTTPYKRLQHVLCHLCNYTANAAKQHTWLYSGFSYDCTSSTAYNTRPTQTAIIPPAPCWRVSQHRRTSSACQDTTVTPGRYTGQHSRPIIIRYIRVRPCSGSMPDAAAYRRPCQPGGLQSGTGSVWHPPPGGAVQRQGRGGRRGTIGGYRRNSFRAFAR